MSTPSNDEVCKVLKRGKRRLQIHKWCRNNLFQQDKKTGKQIAFCAEGALLRYKRKGRTVLLTSQAPERIAINALVNEIPLEVISRDLPTYNDYTAKSKKDILDLYDRALKRRCAK